MSLSQWVCLLEGGDTQNRASIRKGTRSLELGRRPSKIESLRYFQHLLIFNFFMTCKKKFFRCLVPTNAILGTITLYLFDRSRNPFNF